MSSQGLFIRAALINLILQEARFSRKQHVACALCEKWPTEKVWQDFLPAARRRRGSSLCKR
ncbi:hypothetical protein COCON_G00199950 [Conger conger]|uniref:Uncharacterized protein n=1 Tax=Conger conger TaxID=82655 RepID=A0A9Q1D1K3_CONCO|nr:hypothetical protein COCON_G00199950 [Conger conger]